MTNGLKKDFKLNLESVPGSQECLYAVRDVFAGNYTNGVLMELYSGKVPGDYGNYLECQELSNAHFCSVRYPVNGLTTLLASSGICIPSVCQESEIIWVLRHLPNPSWLPIFGEASAECVPKKTPSLTSGGIATVIVIAILSIIVVISTAIDLWRRYRTRPEVPLASPKITRGQYREELGPSRSPSPTTDEDQSSSSSSSLSSPVSSSNNLAGSLSFNGERYVSGGNEEGGAANPLIQAGLHQNQRIEDDLQVDGGGSNGNSKSGTSHRVVRFQVPTPPPGSSELDGHDDGEDEEDEEHKKNVEKSQNSTGDEKGLLMRVLYCFSIAENLDRLTRHFPNNKTNLNPLNSVRVMAMMWVVLGHTCLFTVFIGWTNPIQAMNRLIPNASFQVLLNATLSVDVFFYLAGFLMAYFTLKELRQRGGKVSWLILMLHRLWRMTPTMVMALFFCWTVAPSLGNGPWWRTFMTWTTKACQKYWWTNLLYINNFWNFDLDQTCLAWSWYMSTDMQFFLLAIPLVYVIYRWPKIGFSILGVTCVASIAFIIGMSITHHLSPLVIHMDDGYRKYLYTKPWARISTFAIGIVGAYLLLAHEERGARAHGFRSLPFIPQWGVVATAWIVSLVLVLAPVFGTLSAYRPNATPWTTAQNTAYLAFSRPVFALGLAIMAHLVMTSRAAVSLKDALSHPVWTPFARLTFGAYLYHPIIMFAYYFSSFRPIEFTGTMIFQNWLSFTVLSFLAALISFLLIERPTENLESLFIDIMKHRAKKQRLQRRHKHEGHHPLTSTSSSTQSHSINLDTEDTDIEQQRSLLHDYSEENNDDDV